MRNALTVVVTILLVAHGSVFGQAIRGLGKGPAKGLKQSSKSVGGQVNTYAGKTLKQWTDELKHGDASKRSVALVALTQPVFNTEPNPAALAITNLLHDRDLSPRGKACMALRNINIAKKDVPRVVKALANRLEWSQSRGWTEADPTIRYEAAVSLSRYADQAAEFIPALINGTRDKKSWEIRHTCAAVLWRAALSTKEKTDPRAVKALLSQFSNPLTTYQERLEVVIGLGSLEKPEDPSLQRAVVDQLQKAAHTRNLENRPLAIWAYAGLVTQGEERTIETSLSAIAKHLKPTYNLDTRTQAAQALAALGPKAKSRLPAIIAMLDDKEAVAVDGACLALVRIGDTSDRVLDALISLTTHKDINRIGSAVVALANLKANFPRVITALEKVIEKEKAKEAKEVNNALIAMTQQAIEHIKKAREPKKKAADAKLPANPRKPRQ